LCEGDGVGRRETTTTTPVQVLEAAGKVEKVVEAESVVLKEVLQRKEGETELFFNLTTKQHVRVERKPVSRQALPRRRF